MRLIYLFFIFVAIHAVLCRPTEDDTHHSTSEHEPPQDGAQPKPAKVHHKKSKKVHKTTTIETPPDIEQPTTPAPIVGIGYHGDLPEMALVEQTGLDLKSKVLHAISEAHAFAQKARADIHRGLIEVKMGHDDLDQKARQAAHDALHYHQPYYYPHTFPLLHHMYRREVEDVAPEEDGQDEVDSEVEEQEVLSNSQEKIDEGSKGTEVGAEDDGGDGSLDNGIEATSDAQGEVDAEDVEASENYEVGDGGLEETTEGDDEDARFEEFAYGILGLPQPATFENVPTDEEEEEARNSLLHMEQFDDASEGDDEGTSIVDQPETTETPETKANAGKSASHQVHQRDAGSEEATVEESEEVVIPQVLGRFGSASEESFEEDDEDKSLETRFGDDEKSPLLGLSIPRVAEAKEAAMKLVSDAKEWALRAREDLQSRLEDLHDNAFGKSRSSLDNLLEDVRSKYVFPRSRLGDLFGGAPFQHKSSLFPRRFRRDLENLNGIDDEVEVSDDLEKSNRRRSNFELVGSGDPLWEADTSLVKDMATWDLRRLLEEHDQDGLGLQAKMDLNRYLKGAELSSALSQARLTNYQPLSWKLLRRRRASPVGSLEIVVEAEPELQAIEVSNSEGGLLEKEKNEKYDLEKEAQEKKQHTQSEARSQDFRLASGELDGEEPGSALGSRSKRGASSLAEEKQYEDGKAPDQGFRNPSEEQGRDAHSGELPVICEYGSENVASSQRGEPQRKKRDIQGKVLDQAVKKPSDELGGDSHLDELPAICEYRSEKVASGPRDEPQVKKQHNQGMVLDQDVRKSSEEHDGEEGGDSVVGFGKLQATSGASGSGEVGSSLPKNEEEQSQRMKRHIQGSASDQEFREEQKFQAIEDALRSAGDARGPPRHIEGEAPEQMDASDEENEGTDEDPVVGLGFPITKAIVAGTKLKAATRAAMLKARFGLKKRLAHAKVHHALTKARLATNPFYNPHFLLRSAAPNENFSGEDGSRSEMRPDVELFERPDVETFEGRFAAPMERTLNDLEESFGEGHMGEFDHNIAPRQVMFSDDPRRTSWSHRKQDEELYVWSLNNFASRQHPELLHHDDAPERTMMADYHCDADEEENEKARHFHHQPLFGGKKLFPFNNHFHEQPSHVTINNQQNTFNNALPGHGTANIQISQTTSSTATSQGGIVRNAPVFAEDNDKDAIVSSPNLLQFPRNRPTYRRRRSLPLVRLMVDPNSKLDMAKTMQNVGTIARNSFEDQKAPMYHVRNVAGSLKNAFLSTLKMAPQELVVPSQYKIVDTKEDVVMKPEEVEAIRGKPVILEARPKKLRERLAQFIIERESRHLRPKVDEDRLRQAAFTPPPKVEPRLGASQQEEDPFNFLGTFQKVGTILRDSIRSGREAMQHVSDAAHSARKAFSTAKFAAPRVLTSYSRAPVLQKKPSRLTMISPRFLDIKEDDHAPADLQPDFVGVSDLMNAFGVSDADAQKVGLRRYTIQRNPDTAPILQSRFGNDELPVQTPQNKYYIIAEDIDDEEDAWKSIQSTMGVDSVKDFIGEMRQDIDYIKERQSAQADPELRSFLEDLFEEKKGGNDIKKEDQGAEEEKARMKFPEKLQEPFMGMAEVKDEEEEEQSNSYEDYGQPFDSYYDNIKFEND